MRKTIRLLSFAAGVLLMSTGCEKVKEPLSCSEGRLIDVEPSRYPTYLIQMLSKKDSKGLEMKLKIREKDKTGMLVYNNDYILFNNVYLIVNPEVIPSLKEYFSTIPKSKMFPVSYPEIIQFEYRYAKNEEIPQREALIYPTFGIPPPYYQYKDSEMKFIYITKVCTK